ncbi:MAG: hypothetical protein HWQ38_02325 [Nostoc sp. NMS7]|uniref:hypothetical protein n=1 Tax=Nostoc sp. NMS7 TaxID=2815391 RepID=UPI0025F2C3F3|nr:hypothetical protein [Nostoc sp. NMS7]MBN3945376.1 hypothetical protein [Nostoc sp. NMS7]
MDTTEDTWCLMVSAVVSRGVFAVQGFERLVSVVAGVWCLPKSGGFQGRHQTLKAAKSDLV